MQEQTKELTKTISNANDPLSKVFIYQGSKCLGRILQFTKQFDSWDEERLKEIEIEFFNDDFEDLNTINLFADLKIVTEDYYTRKNINSYIFTPKLFSISYFENRTKINFTL